MAMGRANPSKAAGATVPGIGAGMTILEYGFRPFFLLAGIWAAAVIIVWGSALAGFAPLEPGPGLLFWHSHEMLFGFAAAAMSGFLLTAVPSWTGGQPIQGWRLGCFVAFWLAGRIGIAAAPWLGMVVAAILDLAFLTLMALYLFNEIRRSGNWRNLPVAVLITLFAASNWLVHWQALGGDAPVVDGHRLAVLTLALLLALIGGRIVPSFPFNWLRRNGIETSPAKVGLIDKLAIGLLILTVVAVISAPQSPLTGALAVLTAVLHLARLLRWRGWQTLREPLVWVLHLGYLWLVAGLLLLGAAGLGGLVPENAALHALTMGAFGTMISAVMTRASLGHTGRALHAGPGTLAIYILVTLAAAARVSAPFLEEQAASMLGFAALCWAGGFGLFSVLYFRVLTGPRR